MKRLIVLCVLLVCSTASALTITAGSTDRPVGFIGALSGTRVTGLSSFTVYYKLDDGSETAMTTPTITELTNQEAVYQLLIDEASMTTLDAAHDEEELLITITASGMDAVTRSITVKRAKITEGQSVAAANSAVEANPTYWNDDAITDPLITMNELEDNVQEAMDVNSILANGTYGLAALEALVDDLETRLTAARAGYLDALNGHIAQTGDSFARLGAPAGASVSADIAAVKSDTGNILTDTGAQDTSSELRTLLYGSDTPGATASAQTTAQNDLDILTGTDGATLATSQPNYTPAIAGDAMTLQDDAITSAKFDESTAFPVASADSGATTIARVGVDGDTLETLSDQVDTITDKLPSKSYIAGSADADGGIDSTEQSVVSGLVDSSLNTYDPPTATEMTNAFAALNDPTATEIVDEFETQSQADPTGFHVNVLEVEGTDATNYVESRTLAAASYFDPASDPVANVTLVATTTTNTDMRGTDNAALATSLTTAQNDLDILTGIDGVTLATSQPNYTPATATALSLLDSKVDTAQSDLDILTGTDGATLATSQGNYAPAKAGDAMTLSDDAITASKFDESTAFPIKSDDSGSTQIARVGADGDTLETLSDQVDGISTSTLTAEEVRIEIDNNSTQLSTLVTNVGTPVALDSGSATLASMLTKMADDNGGADYDATNDSLAEGGASGFDPNNTPVQLSSTALANVNAQVDTALSDYGGLKSSTVVDGVVTVDDLLECLLAMIAGKTTYTDNGSTATLKYYKQDGTSVQYQITALKSNGTRTSGGTIN